MPSRWNDLNLRQVRLFLAGQALSRIYTPPNTNFREKSGLAYLPDMEIGEYTIVHAGFAITRLDEVSANETLKMFADLGILEEELGA